MREEIQGKAGARSRPGPLVSLDNELRRLAYRPLVAYRYGLYAAQFLRHLEAKDVSLIDAGDGDIQGFLTEELAAFQIRHGHSSRGLGSWRGTRMAAVRMLMRVCGVVRKPRLPILRHADVLDDYRAWLVDMRGLAPLSVRDHTRAAGAFLRWVEQLSSGEDALRHLSVADIDAYLAGRAVALKRVSRKTLGCLLRSFMRHLHRLHLTAIDLAPLVGSARVYEHERPPRGLKDDDVQRVLTATRLDRKPVGLRDYAMLVLLSTYGMRASEVVQLRLEDLDWRHDRLRIRHSKSGPVTDLPLLRPAGEAILTYLRRGRPRTSSREVFVRAKAPQGRPLRGDDLYQVVARRLRRAQVEVEGKHGPHAFRHGRAIALLRTGVSLKSIGDILGHRRPSSTQAYLRLQTEDLRDVALPVPGAPR